MGRQGPVPRPPLWQDRDVPACFLAFSQGEDLLYSQGGGRLVQIHLWPGRLQMKYCPGRWLVLDLVTQAGSRGCLWVLWPAWLLKLDDAHR